MISKTLADPDLWGHLRFGLDVLESGKIAQVDPYSYLSAGQRWINHEWLSEVVFALVWLAGSSTALILLKTTIGVLTLGLLYIYLLRLELSPIRAGSLLLLASLGVLPAIATVRPHMFTLLFTGILFLVIIQAESGNYRWLWAGPFIFALWVNFHGGFLAGLGFLGIWAIVHISIHRQDWLKFIPPVVVSILAILLNPYGVELVIFLLKTATIPRPEIVEWQPLELVSYLGLLYFILLTIVILALVHSQRKKSIPLMILLGVAVVLPFVAVRHLPLFALAVLVFAGEHIAAAWSRIGIRSKGQLKLPAWGSVLTLLSAIALLVWSFPNFLSIKLPISPTPFFPSQAVALLEESQVSGNLAVEFNWGEYLIWHLEPRIKVSIDGRRETVYSEEIYKINFSFLYGTGEWDTILDEYDTHMALVRVGQPAYNLLKLKSDWELVYEDSRAAIIASQNWSQFSELQDHAQNFIPPSEKEYFP